MAHGGEGARVSGGGNGHEATRGGAADRPPAPQFYREPVILDAVAHARLRLKAQQRFPFAAETNSIVLAADEFYVAQAHYPIVFTLAEPVSALAVVGLGAAHNLFVNEDGTWREGSYVPAYVRRYPFVMVESAGSDNLTLAIDQAAEALSVLEGELLFIAGRPSPTTQRVLEFCAAFQRQTDAARQFAAALVEHEVLVENQAQLNLPSGAATALSGFQVIDEARFNALPDEVINDWRRRGWLGLVYAQLMSMHRWDALARIAVE